MLLAHALAALLCGTCTAQAAAASGPKTHIFFLLIDDYGWAGAGWHNDATTSGQREVQTPNMDALVKEGIELNQHYTFKFCSPTRSSLQSGRNPIHVNVQNVGPDRHNPADPVAGFSAIARNMTGMAQHLKLLGYRTAAVGKWDAGMATIDHTPRGRGYEQSLIYFHHANDYWQYTAGACMPGPDNAAAAATTARFSAACPARFTVKQDVGVCEDPYAAQSKRVASQEECCGWCDATPHCVGWTWRGGDPEDPHTGNLSACFICNVTKGGPAVGRVSGCVGDACDYSHAVTDLWGTDGPAYAMKPHAACVQQNSSLPWPKAAPESATCLYEDALFESEVLRILREHPNATESPPLFLFWAPHIVHGPAQLPKAAFDSLDFITAAEGHGGFARQTYLGRVHYIDSSVGRFVAALKQRGMYENSVIAMSADNGGPLGSANNFPLKGGKHSNWQGGVRVNAFVSGGALPASVRGSTSNELITAWDWYATFVEGIAGGSAIDHRAAAAGLPPVDSVNQWEHLTGRNATSPRTHIPLGSCTDADSGEDAFCQTKGRQQTTVNAVVSYVGAAGGSRKLWKLLVGLHPLAGWTGPKYPNVTAGNEPTLQCGMPPTGGCLYDLEADPTEHAPLEGKEYDAVRMQLWRMLRAHNATTFTPDRGEVSPQACSAARAKYNGFWGPFVE